MTIATKNVFIDFHEIVEEDDDSRTCTGQSSSAPASSSKEVQHCPSSPTPTGTDPLIAAADDLCIDGMAANANTLADPEKETDPSFDAGDGQRVQVSQQNAGLVAKTPLPPAAVQQQLDVMSLAVMDIWSKLSTLESALSHASPQPVELDADVRARDANNAEQCDKQDPTQAIWPSVLPSAINPETSGPRVGIHLIKPASKDADFAKVATQIISVLAAAAQILDSTPDVLGTKVSGGNAGTLATLSIRMVQKSYEDSIRITAIAKAALLEAAARSQNVYVLGYEAIPFVDKPTGTGFSGTLAIASGQHCCWDTYQNGFCRRGQKCKWRHPGRHEIQPIQVVAHQVCPFDGQS